MMTQETPSKLSVEAAQKTRNEHRRALLRKVREVVGLQHDADLRLPRTLTIPWQCQRHDGNEEATDQKGYDRDINKPQYREHRCSDEAYDQQQSRQSEERNAWRNEAPDHLAPPGRRLDR